jgi:hypothetical protein
MSDYPVQLVKCGMSYMKVELIVRKKIMVAPKFDKLFQNNPFEYFTDSAKEAYKMEV